MRRISLALLLTAASSMSGQSAPYIESFEVRVNNIDVIVTDREGNRVTGLTQDDFEVRENGVIQDVTNFSEYRSEKGVDVTVPTAVTRKFVFLIDEMSMHPQKRAALKASLGKLIATGMREGDEAMIVRPSSYDRIPLRFTADRALLDQQLTAIIDRQYFRATTPLNQELHARQQSGTRFPPLTEAYYASSSARARTTLGHIQSIVSAMAEVPGKKTMVLVTEWLPANVHFARLALNDEGALWGSRHYDMRDILNQIAKTASTNGIAIYTLQPEFGLANAVPGPDAANRTNSSTTWQTNLGATEATMALFADRTGASWSREIDQLFTTLQNDLSTYYSLGYRPVATKTSKARSIEVAVKGRPELRVRTRRDVIQKTLTEEMNERVVGHLVYPNNVDELGVKTTVGPLRRTKRNTVVPLTVAVPISNLTLLPDGKKYRGSFRIHYAAAGAGTFSSGVEREQVVEFAAADVDKARARDFKYTTDVEIRSDQKTDIAVGVLDPISKLTSFKTLTIDAALQRQ